MGCVWMVKFDGVVVLVFGMEELDVVFVGLEWLGW